jgi:c-di-GMP-binding flagellar brake protein YcgR
VSGDDHFASLALDGDGDDENRIDKPVEVVAFMQRLIDARALVNVSISPSVSITTMLWWVDPARGNIGFSVDDGQDGLQAIADADMALAVTYLESEKLQFLMERMGLVRDPQGLALECRLPASILRLQRRKSFRVKVPSFAPPSLRFRMPGNPEQVIVCKVMDISVGGCAMLLPKDAPLLEAGTLIESSRVDLEPASRFVTGFEVRRGGLQEAADGRPIGMMLGVRWTRLNPDAEKLVQTYVNRQQKRMRSNVPAR